SGPRPALRGESAARPSPRAALRARRAAAGTPAAAPPTGRSSRPLRGEHQPHRFAVARPLGELGGELAAARPGQLVVLGPPPSVGVAPLRLQPAALLQPVQRGIERTLLDLQPLVGRL